MHFVLGRIWQPSWRSCDVCENCDVLRSLRGSPLVLSSIEQLKGYARLKIEYTVGNLTSI